MRSWGRAGCQTPGMGREMLCQHPTGRARLGHEAAGCPSPPPCHTTQSSSTHRDTEGHPRYSVHISWGLAWRRVPRKPPFPITGAQFSPADSTAFPSPSLQSKVFLGAESGHPLPLWGWAQGCVPRLQGEGAQGSVGSPALVHHLLRAEQSLSPRRGWLWVNNPALSHCSRTPTSLLMKTQGCSKLVPGSKIWALAVPRTHSLPSLEKHFLELPLQSTCWGKKGSLLQEGVC